MFQKIEGSDHQLHVQPPPPPRPQPPPTNPSSSGSYSSRPYSANTQQPAAPRATYPTSQAILGTSSTAPPQGPILPPPSAAVGYQPPPEQPPAGFPDIEVDDSVLSAIEQLSTDPHCAASAQVLSRLFDNILANSTEAKFRKVRLSNPKIQAAIVDAHGGVELLIACGFHILFERPSSAASSNGGNRNISTTSTGGVSTTLGEGTTSSDAQQAQQEEKEKELEEEEEEGFAVLPPDADLDPLKGAVTLLRQLSSTPTSGTPASSTRAYYSTTALGGGGGGAPSQFNSIDNNTSIPAPTAAVAPKPRTPPPQADREWGPPIPRNTKVILPASVDTDVPSWFFERTGFEVKANFLAAVRRREQSQMLLTKAMRERLQRQGDGTAVKPNFAMVKVRLPEGISLQGEFGQGEPVVAVFAWVADSLCDPLQTFDLVLPDRSVLQMDTKAVGSTSGPGRGSSSTTRVSAAVAAAKRPSSVKEAGLLPSVTLNLRWTGPSVTAMAGVPALRQELMMTTAA